jgi:hypothetical protein
MFTGIVSAVSKVVVADANRLGIEHLAEAIHLNEMDFVRLGDDLLITGYVDVHRDS